MANNNDGYGKKGPRNSPSWELFWQQYGQEFPPETTDTDKANNTVAAGQASVRQETESGFNLDRDMDLLKKRLQETYPPETEKHGKKSRREPPPPKEMHQDCLEQEISKNSFAEEASSADDFFPQAGYGQAVSVELTEEDVREFLAREKNNVRKRTVIKKRVLLAVRIVAVVLCVAVGVGAVYYTAEYFEQEMTALRGELDQARIDSQIQLYNAFKEEISSQVEQINGLNAMAFGLLTDQIYSLNYQIDEVIAVLEATDAAILSSSSANRAEMAKRIEQLDAQLAELKKSLELLTETRR